MARARRCNIQFTLLWVVGLFAGIGTIINMFLLLDKEDTLLTGIEEPWEVMARANAREVKRRAQQGAGGAVGAKQSDMAVAKSEKAERLAWIELAGNTSFAPSARCCHTLLFHPPSGTVYSVAGEAGHEANPRKELQVYTFSTRIEKWTGVLAAKPPPDPHLGFYYSAAVLTGDTIYVFGGGRGNHKKSDSLSSLSLSHLTWSSVQKGAGPWPSARYASTMVAFAGSLHLFGGRCEDHDTELRSIDRRDVWEFDIARGGWEERVVDGEKPAPRAWHTAVEYGGEMFVFGGIVRNENTAELWALGLSGGGWRAVEANGHPPPPRHGHVAALWKGSAMIVFAGSTGHDLNDIHIFDFAGREWREVFPAGNAPQPRYTHAGVVVPPCTLYTHGGTTGNMTHVRNAELFKLDCGA